ncbi:procathepsin L-like [Tribolium madens]|uniref:procathepsin L-like n=1 Tax=Tribolium madens TaxID=41895 RepID=UPI001CF75610|nr:procathepsin L-like [Tribolium madens]
MKTFIVLALTVVAALGVPQTAVHQKWAEFKLTHKKQYSSPIEELKRKAIFQDNLAQIEEHNAKYAKGQVTYTKAINQFADMTKEEFMTYVNRGLATKPTKNEKLRLPFVKSDKPAAAEVDWRDSAVTEVKNQGQCGSCWSFSATGALEGQLAVEGKGLISLSEQNLMDCSSKYGNAGCDGGLMDSAFEYIQDFGIMSESAYPYTAKDGTCRYDASQSVTSISAYYDLPPEDEVSLQTAVANYGPIAVAIDATEGLQFYSGGIFQDETCDSTSLNHGVLAVGYGHEDGYDYWIIKNSWGSSWGEAGYFKLVRNYFNHCGVASQASYPVL